MEFEIQKEKEKEEEEEEGEENQKSRHWVQRRMVSVIPRTYDFKC